MTEHTAAAQSADTNPLSDEYVNAVIQRHGYQSTEAVCARLYQWIGLHGGENGVTLLIYEAHKVLSKLRAPVADELVASLRRMASVAPASECEVLHAAANALASAPATNQATSEGQNMFYEGLFEGETERQRDRRLKWMKTVRPASAPVAFYRQSLRDLVDVVWKEATESTAVPDTAWADRLIDRVFPSVLASAPVADERAACPTDVCQAGKADGVLCANDECDRANGVRPASAPVAGEATARRQALLEAIHRYGNARAMAEHNIAYRDEVRNTADALIALFDAAPQASEAVRQQRAEDVAYIARLRAALILARDSHGVCLLTDPQQDAWKARLVNDVISAALSAQPGAQKEQNDAG